MRKLTGIFAGTLALTLVFGMTAFAAPSKSTADEDNSATTKELTDEELAKKGYTEEKLKEDGVDSSKATIVDTVTTQNAAATINASQTGNTLTTSETVGFDEKEVADDMSSAQKADAARKADALADAAKKNAGNAKATLANGLVVQPVISSVSPAVAFKLDEVAKSLAEAVDGSKDANDVAVKGAAEVTLPGVSAEALAKGVSITIDFGFVKDARKNYTLYHLVNGKWQTEKITNLTNNGQVTATVYSLSPVAISEYVLVESNDDDDNNDAADTSSTSTSLNSKGKVASPKTGEAAPIAGVVAIAALAGAAVAAKKVRYNR